MATDFFEKRGFKRTRYYNPDLKRFMSCDILEGSIADSTSLNQFTFVNGNPALLSEGYFINQLIASYFTKRWGLLGEVNMIKNAVNIPWPIIGVVLLWGMYGLVYLSDRQAFIAMVKKCSAEKFNNSELITNFTKFFKFHPLSPHKTDLIVKMIPSLVAEKRPIINWIRKINGKDIDVQFSDALLFSYFVLQEKGYINELNLLKNKTDQCFSDASEFHKIKNCIFHSELINVDEIDALNGTYSKGIAYFYTALNSYMLGNIEFGNIYAEKAVSLIPEKTMSDLVFDIRSSHEEAN